MKKIPLWAGAFACLLLITARVGAQTLGDRYVWLMNGLSFVSSTDLGEVDSNWHIAAVGTFHSGSKGDIVWENLATGERCIWLMDGLTFNSGVFLTPLPTDWRIAGVADFDGNGTSDIIWENLQTGDRTIWLMNGTTSSSGVYLTNVSTDWHIAGAGNFHGSGTSACDLLWESSANGDHYVWLMNGTTLQSAVYIGNRGTNWMATTGHLDPNSGNQADILWSNTTTGDREVWLMSGTALSSTALLANVAPQWLVVTGDFNADGKADLIWEYDPAGDFDANGMFDWWERANFGHTGVDPMAMTTIGGANDGVPYLIKEQLGMNPAALATTDGTIYLKVTKPQN